MSVLTSVSVTPKRKKMYPSVAGSVLDTSQGATTRTGFVSAAKTAQVIMALMSKVFINIKVKPRLVEKRN
jgi:hypothetical protein